MIAAAFAHCPFAARSPSSPVVAWVAYYPTPLRLFVVVSPFASLLLLSSLVLLIIDRRSMSVFIVGSLLYFLIIVSKAAPFAHCLFGARICFCSPRRSRGLTFRCRLVFVLCLRSPLGVLFMASKLAPFAHCPFAARFPYCAGPFAHCPFAARFLALLVVPPPPEFAIVPPKAFGFLIILRRSLRLRIVLADL